MFKFGFQGIGSLKGKMKLSVPLYDNDYTDNIEPIKEEDTSNKNNIHVNELLVKVQDLESRLPIDIESNSNEVPIRLLSSSATLTDVISAVNELIKRDLTKNRVE